MVDKPQITPRRGWLDGHVVLARRLESPRFRRIETFSPRNHLHAFRLVNATDIDDKFRAWMSEAYRVGNQEHLILSAVPRWNARRSLSVRRDAVRRSGSGRLARQVMHASLALGQQVLMAPTSRPSATRRRADSRCPYNSIAPPTPSAYSANCLRVARSRHHWRRHFGAEHVADQLRRLTELNPLVALCATW